MSMVFNASVQVPNLVDAALPTASKIALKRGIAGTKSKRKIAAKALETKDSIHKSKKFCPVSTIVLYVCSYHSHLHTVPDYPLYRAHLQIRERKRP